MKSGIYIIRNLKSKKVYIGQSIDVKRRIGYHKSHLLSGTHANDYLQKSFNADGENNFKFEILEECEINKLDEREIYWIRHFESDIRKNGYNIESGGHLGHTWNDDAKERRSGKGNPMYGKKHSKQFVERIRTINRASSDKLTEEDVANIKTELCNESSTMKELAAKYNVDFTTISKIRTCKNWDWVLPEVNDILVNQEENKKKELKKKIKKMHEQGKSNTEIALEVNYSSSRISAIINNLFPDEKIQRENNRLKLIQGVQEDFKKGISKKEIMSKYNIGHNFFVKCTKDIRAKQKNDLVEKVQKMRNSGMMVKDIAKELNLHRTTVTEYCKKVHGNTESV